MNQTITLKTDMSCNSCVSKVKPAFEASGINKGLKFDMDSPDKTVRFEGSAEEESKAISILERIGYQASPLKNNSSQNTSMMENTDKKATETFKPLILIGLFLIGVTALVEIRAGSLDSVRAMNVFMGGFFIFFSFFKFLGGVSAFADAFSTYDVIAKKTRFYALIYPFVELALGVGFILEVFPIAINAVTIVLMAIGNVGVWTALRKKQTIQCACLGTIFKLPMTKVTLFENTLMFLMAVAALLIHI